MKLLAALVALTAIAVAGGAAAQSAKIPGPDARCPSKWGKDDERGAGNHMKPATVMRAAQLIKTGETFELAHELSPAMPLNPGRAWNLQVKRTTGPFGENQRFSNEEIVTSEIGQVGTQFDGFAHQQIGKHLYNCVEAEQVATRTGFNKLGVEKVGTIFTRGVLIDVAALKGVDMLPLSYEITVQDLEQALQKQGGVKIQPGDAVLVYTGWSKLWAVDNAKYLSGCPGLGLAAAEWLIKQDPILLGSDNWPVEVAPNPDKSLNLPVHQLALAANGVHLLENLRLEPLAQARAYEFALLLQPLKIKGATGSTVAPTAIR